MRSGRTPTLRLVVRERDTACEPLDETVRVVALDARAIRILACCDLDIAGFFIETAQLVAPGIRSHFEFRCWDGLVATIPAVAVHAHTTGTRHFSAWEYLSGPTADRTVDLLVASANMGRRR